jgi:hemoglobin
MYEFAGGGPAFQALAVAHHKRCLNDPVLSHPFSHPGNPEHVERLADYLAEVFGGPLRYSESFGGHSAMLGIHAGQGADEDLGSRFVAAFVQAADLLTRRFCGVSVPVSRNGSGTYATS